MFEKFMFGIVFPLAFCLGGGLSAKQGYVLIKTKRDKKLRCLSHTIGKIVNIESMPIKTGSGRYRRCFFPTYEYVVDNEVFTVEYKAGTTRCQYKIGDQVKVWYDASSSNYSYIDGYKEDTFSAIVGLILGSIFVLCGLFVGVVMWLRWF